MHIVDGALSLPVLAAGGAATLAGTAYGLKKMDMDRIPQVGLLSAAFFLASLIHVPIGPSSVHLILNGLVGLVLGWAAFPALVVGLLLQAVFFGFGGLVVLGVNAFNIAAPAVLVHLLLKRWIARSQPGKKSVFALGFFAGSFTIMMTTALVALSLAFSGEEFIPAIKLVFYAHLPIMILEGFLTGAAVMLVVKVKPELFQLADNLSRLTTRTEPLTNKSAVKARIASLFLIFGLLFSNSAMAHNIIADAYVEGTTIEGEVGFSNGDPALDAPVTIKDSAGNILGQTTTDADGIFYYQATAPIDHHIEVNAGAGHVAKLFVPAADLSAIEMQSEPQAQMASKGAEAKPVMDAMQEASATPAVQSISPEELTTLIEASVAKQVSQQVAKQIKPLRKQILQYENKVRLQDTLGGLGYILGLTGLAMWWSERKKRLSA